MIVVGKLGIGLHTEGPVLKVKAHIVYFEKRKTISADASSSGLQPFIYSFTVSASGGDRCHAHTLL